MAQKRLGWHREDIKGALRKRFGPISALSIAWGFDASAITNTLRRPLNSRRVERRIAEALNVPLHELWPDRWAPDGSPLPRISGADRSANTNSANRQKRKAA